MLDSFYYLLSYSKHINLINTPHPKFLFVILGLSTLVAGFSFISPSLMAELRAVTTMLNILWTVESDSNSFPFSSFFSFKSVTSFYVLCRYFC